MQLNAAKQCSKSHFLVEFGRVSLFGRFAALDFLRVVEAEIQLRRQVVGDLLRDRSMSFRKATKASVSPFASWQARLCSDAAHIAAATPSPWSCSPSETRAAVIIRTGSDCERREQSGAHSINELLFALLVINELRQQSVEHVCILAQHEFETKMQ